MAHFCKQCKHCTDDFFCIKKNPALRKLPANLPKSTLIPDRPKILSDENHHRYNPIYIKNDDGTCPYFERKTLSINDQKH